MADERPDFVRWRADAVVQHCQPDLAGVHVRLRLGDVTADGLRALAEIVRRYSAGEARVSLWQNLFLPWVPRNALSALYDELHAAGLGDAGAETVADVTTCPAADTCRLGIASAKGLGSALSTALERGELASFAPEMRDVTVKISGCPNGCAQHTVADVGFHSAAQTQGGRTVPSYLVFLGGSMGVERARVGRVVGRFPARRGVDVLGTLLALFRAERAPGESFGDCLTRLGDARVKAELEPLRAVPSFDEDPSFYKDWGHENERFAVRQGVKGECAGTTVSEKTPALADAVEHLAQAQAYLAHAEHGAAMVAAYEAAAAAARVPLYGRLVDPFTAEQALWEFENIFVRAGHTGGAWTDVSAEFAAMLRGSNDASDEDSGPRARAAVDRARAFVAFCGEMSADRDVAEPAGVGEG